VAFSPILVLAAPDFVLRESIFSAAGWISRMPDPFGHAGNSVMPDPFGHAGNYMHLFPWQTDPSQQQLFAQTVHDAPHAPPSNTPESSGGPESGGPASTGHAGQSTMTPHPADTLMPHCVPQGSVAGVQQVPASS
jgi:hypothetical protein